MNDKFVYPTQGGTPGMRMSEHIAIEAMKALLANPEHAHTTYEKIAQAAVTMSQHMMKEL